MKKVRRNSEEEKPLDLWYSNYDAVEFKYDKNADGHDSPSMTKLDRKDQSICGEFKRYTFEIRGYHFNGEGLTDVSLYSSEAEMLIGLMDEKIDISQLTQDSVYSLRKMEYNLRLANQSEKSMNNFEYHINEIKNNLENK